MSDEKLYEGRVGPLRAEDPPPKVVRSSLAHDILMLVPQMQKQPKRWFRVAEFPDVEGAGRARSTIAKKAPYCEWTSRRFTEGSALWGRYVGNSHAEK